MKNKILIISFIFIFSIITLSQEVIFEKSVYEGQNVKIAVNFKPGQTFSEAKLFFKVYDERNFSILKLRVFQSSAETVIPAALLHTTKYSFYVQLIDEKGLVQRFPEGFGNYYQFEVLPDTLSPKIKFISPLNGQKFFDNELIPIAILLDEKETGIDPKSIIFKINDKVIENYNLDGNLLTYKLTNVPFGEYYIFIQVSDKKGNISNPEKIKVIMKEKGPPLVEFTFNKNYELASEFKFESKISTSNELIEKNVIDSLDMNFSQNADLDSNLRFWIFNFGFRIFLSQESTDFVQLFKDFTNQLNYDLKDSIRLLNPMNMDDYTIYEKPRNIDVTNNLNFYLDLAFLKYKFFDNQINFNPLTVNNYNVRGHYAKLDLYLANAEIAVGNSDVGIFETSYPRYFAGLKTGINLFELLKANVDFSIISDYQGTQENRYIKTLFNIPDTITPKQNILIGANTSLNLWVAKINANLGIDVYIDDSSNIISITEMASSIADIAGDPTIKDTVENYVTQIEDVFPKTFDYFPISNGIVAAATDKYLLGTALSLNGEIPILNLNLYYLKADKNYKSLGVSAPSNVMKYGITFKKKLWILDLKGNYELKKDNTSLIGLDEILGLALGNSDVSELINNINPLNDLLGKESVPASSTTDDIRNITEKYKLNASLKLGFLGTVGGEYSVEHQTNNAEFLINESATTTITNDDKKDKTITAYSAYLKNIGFKTNNFSLKLSFDAGLKNIIDKINTENNAILLTYGVKTNITLGKVGLNGAYKQKQEEDILTTELSGGFKTKLFQITYANIRKTTKDSPDDILSDTNKIDAKINLNIDFTSIQFGAQLQLPDIYSDQEGKINAYAKFAITF
ncbi:hypothetical protein SAMN02745164_00776 [Marinitoga hydrogenitolerans DSM 16785]|uniref:Uncharacterized protein n=1 Tax=Marinitoga hydrogenitolerans (strain DSM 16785 / JCM 12826 / AT1271) TaxID=1122195 RepID=A0A1M4UUB4_MARH1|nr:hypothetical protein [Marinitoga hydrogenitolerans]SHE60275.1 hypothetical protein SAMN02745164_00776 [Marinitoga hydrogenitolerans DSM 16785]